MGSLLQTAGRRKLVGGTADISLTYAPGAIQIEVLDDGPANGQPVLATRGGHGLIGMRERVALYGGELEASPRQEGGFALRADFPLETSLT